MTTKTITPYTALTQQVPGGSTVNDVTITLTSKHVKPMLEVFGSPNVPSIIDTQLTVTPDSRWMEGITIEVVVGNTTTKYIVPSNLHLYAPEHRLYSLDNLQPTGNYATLQNLGLVTPEERSLLEAMGPKLTALVLRMSKCLVTSFIYNNTAPVAECTMLKGLRRMQQLMYMLGLDALVEDILLTPGPDRDWFRKARIVTPIPDSDIEEKYLELDRDIQSLRNAMNHAKLNVRMVESVDMQLSPKLRLNPVIKGIVILFCAIRYTHDNPKFSY